MKSYLFYFASNSMLKMYYNNSWETYDDVIGSRMTKLKAFLHIKKMQFLNSLLL